MLATTLRARDGLSSVDQMSSNLALQIGSLQRGVEKTQRTGHEGLVRSVGIERRERRVPEQLEEDDERMLQPKQVGGSRGDHQHIQRVCAKCEEEVQRTAPEVEAGIQRARGRGQVT